MKAIGKICVLLLLLLLIGCGANNITSQKPQPQSQGSKIEKHMDIKPEFAQKAKKIALTVKGVDESTAVAVEKDIYTAVKVSGFQRLRLSSIKEEVYKKISTINKDYKVHVTSDKKLFVQLQQIEKKINEQKQVADFDKKIKKIEKDMQE